MIRWIRRELGTGPHAELPEGPWRVLDVRMLVDKEGNDPETVRRLIDEGVEAVRAGKTVVVACDFGVSRSNAIAAGILASTERWSVDRALREVVDATGETEVKVGMVETVRYVLGEAHRHREGATVMVTGGTGFLGRHLVARLSREHRVVAPDRREVDLEAGPATLADYCREAGVTRIIHLAYPRIYTNAQALGASLTMLRVLLDTCRALDTGLVLVSGASVFSGHSEHSLVADETTIPAPKGVHGDAKYLEETLADLHARRGEVDCTICRLAPVYGPSGDRPRLIRTFWEAAMSGQPIRTHLYRNGPPALDLLYVEDAVEGLARLATRPDASGIFHFGTGQLHDTADLAARICALADATLHHEEIPIDDDICNVAFPSHRARQDLGWAPRWDIDRGLAETILSFR